MADSTIVHFSGDWVLYQGAAASGALLYVYDAGTTTLASIYTDTALTVASANPVTADSGGLMPFAYKGTGTYKVVLKTSSGTTIKSEDVVPGALDTSTFTAATYAKPDTDCAAKTADYTVVAGDLGTVINCNPTSATFTVTLISAVTATNGRWITIKHTGTANSVNISGVSSQTIDGLTTKTISGQYEALTLVSDGANWHIRGDANRTVVGGTITPQGYLTLTSLTPIIASSVTAATAVYYTPFVGNLIPIYNGTRFVNYEFSELTLTLASQHAINTIYDVFVFLNSNVVTIGTGPAWSVSTAGSGARGTGAGTTQLTRVNGLLTNTVAITARNSSTTYSVGVNAATYVGSIFIDGTAGQITSHVGFGQSRKWGVWNAYNRMPINLIAGDAGGSWNYNSTTRRASNGNSANSLTVFTGLAEEISDLRFSQYVYPAQGASGACLIGIGYNSTTATSGSETIVSSPNSATFNVMIHAAHLAPPRLGINVVTCLESTPVAGGAANQQFNGTEPNMRLTAQWRG